MVNEKQVYEDTAAVLRELLQSSEVGPDKVLLVCCSISKVEGRREDTTGDPGLALSVWKAIKDNLPAGMPVAVQCCEHLNRALIIERDLLRRENLTEVNVRPVPEAGGTFAAAAYEDFADPVVIEDFKADLGIDIGLNMIGMHLREVAMPLVLQQEYVGGARVVAARTRPRLIGGARAQYLRR